MPSITPTKYLKSTYDSPARVKKVGLMEGMKICDKMRKRNYTHARHLYEREGVRWHM